MALQVSMLSEDSIVAWEIESTRGTAPSAGTWKDFGIVTDFRDLGPENQLKRFYTAGAGRNPNSIESVGQRYGNEITFQVVDPRVLGFAWGEEASAPTQIGSTSFYRHTVRDTENGQLPSMSVHMRDQQGSSASSPSTSKTTFLETVVNEVTIRGEPVGEDGSGGELNATLQVLPHDDDSSVADKAVSLTDKSPYRAEHASINLWGETDIRLSEFEFRKANNASHKYFWNSANDGTPQDAPPENVEAVLTGTITADGLTYANLSGKQLRQAAADEEVGDCTLEFVRLEDEEEFQVNITDAVLSRAEKARSTGPVEYDVLAWVTSSTFEYVDTNSSRFFPS